MRNCLTVDVEEWFHVCGVEGPLAPTAVGPPAEPRRRDDAGSARSSRLVRRPRARSSFSAGSPPDIRPSSARSVDAGHEIGSHGHLHQRVYELTPDALPRAISRRAARRWSPPARGSVRGYRAPEWSINDRSLWALDVLARAGFAFDSSMAPMRIVGDPDYPKQPHLRSTPCGDLLEFPPLVDRRFGQNMPLGLGWGLRMTAPRRVIRAIEDRNARGIPVALAVHPWEIDPDPPRVTLPPARPSPTTSGSTDSAGGSSESCEARRSHPMGEVLGPVPDLHMTVDPRVASLAAAVVWLCANPRSRRRRQRCAASPSSGPLDGEPLPADLATDRADPGSSVDRRRMVIGSRGNREPHAPARRPRACTGAATFGRARARTRASRLTATSSRGASSFEPLPSAAAGRLPATRLATVRAGAAPDVNRYVYLLEARGRADPVGRRRRARAAGRGSGTATSTGRAACSPPAPVPTSTASRIDGSAWRRRRRFRLAVERLAGARRAGEADGDRAARADPFAGRPGGRDVASHGRRACARSARTFRWSRSPATTRRFERLACGRGPVRPISSPAISSRSTSGRPIFASCTARSNVTSTIPHRLVYSLTGFETFLVYWSRVGRRAARSRGRRSPTRRRRWCAIRSPAASQPPTRCRRVRKPTGSGWRFRSPIIR